MSAILLTGSAGLIVPKIGPVTGDVTQTQHRSRAPDHTCLRVGLDVHLSRLLRRQIVPAVVAAELAFHLRR